MKGSKRKDFSVYEFNEADEATESESGRFLTRLRSRIGHKPDSVAKYNVLQAYLHASDGAGYTADTWERKLASAEESSVLDEVVVCSTICEHDENCHDEFEPERSVGDSLAVGASTLVAPLAVFSDDDESWTSHSRSPSTTATDLSDRQGYWESPVSNECYSALKENVEMEINLCPEYVVYQNVFYAEAHISFFSDCFKIEYSDATGNEENCVSQWKLCDVIRINSQWSGIVEAAHVEIHLRENAAIGVEKIDEASGIVKITFPIHDVHWLEKEQKIFSLAERYRDIWNTVSDSEQSQEEDNIGPDVLYSADYFTEILEPFDDVIYPIGDPDAVSVSKRDIELLQPDTFINDTIIDFYIKYLKNKLQPDDKHRFHFFNSFFFRKLADPDKDLGSDLEGKEAFRRVRKWTRRVDIFEKDYIFIPVNFSLHWSLLVLCHPGEVASLEDDDRKESSKIPCILHMDSMKGSHSGLSNLVQSYLWEEWKERHPESPEDYSSKFSNLRFVSLELPQQENLFDCGLFLLHYVELFLEEAPINFSPFKITDFSSFLSVNWFQPAEASCKRSLIRKLIYDLSKDPSQKVLPTTCTGGYLSSKYVVNDINQKPLVEFFSEQCGAAKTANCDSAPSIGDGENELELLTGSPVDDVQSDKALEKDLREFLKLGTNSLSSPNHQNHPFVWDTPVQMSKAGESSDEEHGDGGRQHASLNQDTDSCQPLVGHTTTQVSPLCPPEDVGVHNTVSSSMQEVKDIGGNSLLKSLESDSISPVLEDAMENCEHVPNSPSSASGENLETCTHKDSSEMDNTKGKGEDCKDSLEINAKVEGGECVSPFFSSQEDPASSCKHIGVSDNEISSDKDDLQLRIDESITRVDEQSHKRRKIMNP